MAMMRWIATVSLLLFIVGCSDKPADENNTEGGANNSNDDEVACLTCGPALACGESCDDPCGCCCDEGEERVRDGQRQRCASNCWENLGPIRDTGSDAGSGTDAGDDDVGGNAGGEDAGRDTTAPTCTEEPNGGSPPSDTCQHGRADWIVWKWVAPRDMSVEQIELHTPSEGSGALLADDGDSPGAVLFMGPLSEANADGWRTFDADAPVELSANTTYWIGENVLTCSTVTDGTEFDYYTADALEGPWSGPFNGHPFTARVSGVCP